MEVEPELVRAFLVCMQSVQALSRFFFLPGIIQLNG